MNGPRSFRFRLYSHSFRSRLYGGAVLSAAGMLMLFHLIFLHAIRHFPGVFRMRPGLLAVTIAVCLVILGLLQIRTGLSPFDQLRARLAGVREGRDHRLEGHYPSELQPLVNDLNTLLDHRERAVRRAQAKAGDLAHGLKTPLSVLSQEAERAREAGHAELAATISNQVERMRKQVDYHLAQARAAASGVAPGTHCQVAASVDGLVRTLSRLYAERGIVLESSVHSEHAVRTEREDLDEMLGNLLDNACKWAKARVTVTSSEEGSNLLIMIDDDGPGLDPDKRHIVLRRGVRADEAAPGSGLGLAIVRDLAELHGGSITLDTSPMGGVRARLRLPLV